MGGDARLAYANPAKVPRYSRPLNVGDHIEFLDTPNMQGEVVDFSLLFTVLRTESGDLIQIPNNQFFQRAVRRQKGDTEIALEEQINREKEHIPEHED